MKTYLLLVIAVVILAACSEDKKVPIESSVVKEVVVSEKATLLKKATEAENDSVYVSAAINFGKLVTLDNDFSEDLNRTLLMAIKRHKQGKCTDAELLTLQHAIPTNQHIIKWADNYFTKQVTHLAKLGFVSGSSYKNVGKNKQWDWVMEDIYGEIELIYELSRKFYRADSTIWLKHWADANYYGYSVEDVGGVNYVDRAYSLYKKAQYEPGIKMAAKIIGNIYFDRYSYGQTNWDNYNETVLRVTEQPGNKKLLDSAVAYFNVAGLSENEVSSRFNKTADDIYKYYNNRYESYGNAPSSKEILEISAYLYAKTNNKVGQKKVQLLMETM